MKRFLKNIEDTLADSALLEMGVAVAPIEQTKAIRESLEENLIEVAFAEEADYDQIHEDILREHRRVADIAYPGDCHFGDNEVCLV
jgi:hypothetical protein